VEWSLALFQQTGKCSLVERWRYHLSLEPAAPNQDVELELLLAGRRGLRRIPRSLKQAATSSDERKARAFRAYKGRGNDKEAAAGGAEPKRQATHQ